MTTCREMSRYTKEPCGNALPCPDHAEREERRKCALYGCYAGERGYPGPHGSYCSRRHQDLDEKFSRRGYQRVPAERDEAICVARFQVTRHGAIGSAVCGKPKSDRVHDTKGPFPPGPPPLPGINLHEFREFPPIARDWKPAFHQSCDVCTMPCAWGHTGEGWTSYLCMNCYDAMVERLKMSRERAIGRMEAEGQRGEYAAASEPWTAKNQPQPADVVPSITGDSGEVWIFQGVKVATHTDINAAFAMRDKINQAGEQWLSAFGYATQQDRRGIPPSPDTQEDE